MKSLSKASSRYSGVVLLAPLDWPILAREQGAKCCPVTSQIRINANLQVTDRPGFKSLNATKHDSPIHLFIFSEDEVVAREGDTEDDGSDSLKAVDPLLPLRPLAPNVKHPANNS